MLDVTRNNSVINNDEWEILTPTGWSDFSGISKTAHEKKCIITFEKADGEVGTFTCSTGHQIFVNREKENGFIIACLLMPGVDFLIDENNNKLLIKKIDTIFEKSILFDIINVAEQQEYITDSLISHNCAHVEGIEELWLGLKPTLSTGGSAILLSTPSGVGTLFHRIWQDANTGDSDFYPIELPWTVHPERDNKWFEKERKELVQAFGERGVAQELLCSFMASGDTFLRPEIMDQIFNRIKEPVDYLGPADGKKDLWIWKKVVTGHKYIVCADPARGDGADFAAFHVIDTDESEIVAEYRSKLAPDKLADFLVQVGFIYNSALICAEKNSIGVATAYRLKELSYPNLYFEKFHKNVYMVYTNIDTQDEIPGLTVSTANRMELVARLETVLRNGALKTYSKRLHTELQTFVWKGNKPQAQRGYNDDLVMALAIGNSLFEANGSTAIKSDDLSKALLAGMSVSTKTMDTSNPSPDGIIETPILSDNNLTDFNERVKMQRVGASKTHNYNDIYWRQFSWVWKD